MDQKNPFPIRETLETRHLILRRYKMSDAGEVRRLINDWDVVRWLAQVPYPYSLSDARAWIERTNRDWADGTDYQFAVLEKGEGTESLIGAIGLRGGNRGEQAVRELGYWFTTGVWGCGYGTEAARAVLDFGFQDLATELVWATALPDNERSKRVLVKIGMVADGLQTGHFAPIGRTVVCPRYILSRDRYDQLVIEQPSGTTPGDEGRHDSAASAAAPKDRGRSS